MCTGNTNLTSVKKEKSGNLIWYVFVCIDMHVRHTHVHINNIFVYVYVCLMLSYWPTVN